MPKKVDHGVRRSELADAVLAVVARDGMDGVTIRGVAAEAGWTRGVIGHYFENRDDLLLFAYREGLARTRRALSTTAGESPLQLLRRWLLLTLPLDPASALNHAIYIGFVGSAARRPVLARAIEAETDELDQCTRDLLKRCMDEGTLRPPFDLEAAAEVLSAFVDGLGLHIVASPTNCPPEEAERLLDVFLNGWCPADEQSHVASVHSGDAVPHVATHSPRS